MSETKPEVALTINFTRIKNAIKGKILAFFDSPANTHGLSVWLGTVITALASDLAGHTLPTSVDIFGAVVGLLFIIQPESSVTVSQLEVANADVIAALRTPSAAAILKVAQDAAGVAEGLKAKQAAAFLTASANPQPAPAPASAPSQASSVGPSIVSQAPQIIG